MKGLGEEHLEGKPGGQRGGLDLLQEQGRWARGRGPEAMGRSLDLIHGVGFFK